MCALNVAIHFHRKSCNALSNLSGLYNEFGAKVFNRYFSVFRLYMEVTYRTVIPLVALEPI